MKARHWVLFIHKKAMIYSFGLTLQLANKGVISIQTWSFGLQSLSDTTVWGNHIEQQTLSYG